MSGVLERIGRLSPEKQRLLQQKLRERSTSRVPPVLPSPLRGLTDRFPCSFSQQRLWFLHQMDPSSPAYNVPAALRLVGPLDVGALARALDGVARRHEVLRSTFEDGEEGPLQKVGPGAAVALPVIDLAGLSAALRGAELERRAAAEARRPFSLERGPVLRAVLLRLGEDDHALVVCLHHIVSDDWSRGILVRDLAALYSAVRRRLPPLLPELPVQYADFAEWQRRWLQGEVLDAQVEHWRLRLAGAPPLLALPTDRPRPAVQSSRGGTRTFTLPAGLSRGLEELARQEEATLFTVLLAAFQTLLCRWSGQEDVSVGTPVAGRRHRETEDLIGFFVNTLVMRSDLSGDPPFRKALRRTRETLLDDQANQDLPFERLVDELRIERTLSHTPLFQVMLALQNAPRAAAPVEGVTLAPLDVSTVSSKFDLTLVLAAGEEGLDGALEHSADLFDATTADRFLAHFRRLLEGVAADPGRTVWEMPLLSPAERHHLLAEVNPGAARFPAAPSLHRLFEAQAACSPAAPAVVCDGERLSYGELDALASRWAHRLRELGVGPEARVGLCTERSLAMVVGILAILKAGGAYVPLDPAYPEERLRFLLSDSGVRVLLTQGALQDRLPRHGARVIDLEETPEEAAAPAGLADPDPDNLAYVIYTSGSTGRPKGVGVTHANVVRLFAAAEGLFDFGPGDTWTLFHSHAFDFSVWEIWGALLHGGTLVVIPYWESRSPAAFRELLARERVTVLSQTPSAFRQLVEADAAAGGRDDLALRYVIFGGEALDLPSLEPWFGRHGDETPRLVNMYGITETTVHVTWRPVALADLRRGAGSVIGAALPDLSLAILDRRGEPAPLGVPGEMHVGGAGLARGYLGRPELTAERFVPDPFSREPGGRLYRSGDLARCLPGGDLEYLGRIDHQVKIRGFRIELGEIEAALEEHPAVRQAVVLAREAGEGERRLVAWLVAGDGSLPHLEELRTFLRRRLPEHMVPAAFVPVPAVPLTAHGKIDRAALPDPEGERSALAGDWVAPRTPAEQALAGIWCQALRLDRVGAGDNFFALGGDSILSIRVRTLAAAQGLRFELQDLFRYQTLAELAAAVEAVDIAEDSGAPSLEPFALVSPEDRERLPGGLEDAYPTTLLQLGMLFHSEGSTAYHNVSSFTLRGPFDSAALARAVERLAARHPVLRTSFDGTRFREPLQLVHREARIPLRIGDLREMPPADCDEALARRFETEASSRFDWSLPPLARLWAHALTGDTFELGIAEHHAIVDGWSFATLLSELLDLYFASLGGAADPLPPPPGPLFRDFVALERRALESEESRRFWSARLDGHSPLRLPRWPGHGSGAGPRVREISIPLPPDLEEAAGRAAETAGVPVKSVFLAAHLRVLERLGGGPDVLAGLVVNGRPEVEGGERALGLFLNTVPLRVEVSGGSGADLARAAFAAERDLLPHRRVPLAEIQRRESAGAPLFEVTFNYTHFHVLHNASRVEVLAARTLAETNFTLAVHVSRDPLGTGVAVELQYDEAELHPAQARDWGELYVRALAALARHPGGLWAEDLLLTPAQRHQVLLEWNDSRAPLRGRCLHELVEKQVDRAPDTVAVAWDGGSLTYRELDARANGLAHRLHGLGAGPDVPVGLCAERSPGMVVGLLAILKAGGAWVPLDPDYPRERLALLLEDSGAPVLLVQEHLAGRLPATGARTILLEGVETGRGDRPAGEAWPESLACVLYTSGSTGRPKGVLVPHAGLVNRLLWAQAAYPVTAEDRTLQKASFSFDFSVWELFAPLLAGGRVFLARPGGQRDAAYLARTIREQGITLVHFIPSMLQAYLAEESLEDCPRLRSVFAGGEALSPDLVETFHGRARVPLRNQYGPTEISIDTTDQVCRPGESPGFVPLGRPLANTAVHVLDRRLVPALPGVPGELWVGGAGVTRGYLGRPDLTAERFVPDPHSSKPGARLYRTGDLALRLPDGNLRFLGRSDHQVKIRGYRIELGEIEAALRVHPRVREAVVLARESTAGDRRLVAWVVGENLPESELREHLRGTLPEPLLPVAFVVLPALPRTPSGKLDRRALPDPGEAARPEREAASPRDETELRLAQLLEELLDIRPVGIRDDFFALGGHSLLALRLVGRIERLFGRRLPLSDLLAAPTVEGLARLLRSGAAPSRSLVVPLETRGDGPPLFFVHPVGGNVLCYLPLVRQAEPEGPVYGIQSPAPGRSPWTVETLAALYLDALRQVRPAGPHLLAGWSMGGVVAYEMARQLEAAGEEVPLVLLLDVGPPDRRVEADADAAAELAGFAEDVEGTGSPLDAAVCEDLLAREETRELFEIYRANRRALCAYRPGPYRGRLTLIWSEATAAGLPEACRGWSELARGGADVHILPGDHYSLLKPPCVPMLSGLLRTCVRSALAGAGSLGG